jgi:hypothetical protein
VFHCLKENSRSLSSCATILIHAFDKLKIDPLLFLKIRQNYPIGLVVSPHLESFKRMRDYFSFGKVRKEGTKRLLGALRNPIISLNISLTYLKDFIYCLIFTMTHCYPHLAPPPYTPTNILDAGTTTQISQAPNSATAESLERVPSIERYWYKKGIFGLHFRATLRISQLVFAVVVAGLYGVDLAQATKTNSRGPTNWIFAEIVACFSILTCVIHAAVTVKRVAWSAWDGVLFVLWLAQVGVFGTTYLSHEIKPEYEAATKSVSRMKAAVWVDLINMLLWFLTFILGVAWCIRARRLSRRTEKSGNAQEVDLERMDEQEIGCESMKEACLEKKGYRAGVEKGDE